ncbi:MAG TPA: helix-turn-helix domain-containing protein [Bryobacteraceae bacterium]|nr:helix-turn-helix domain-containing protein [Bryobacteraceae bacterium]
MNTITDAELVNKKTAARYLSVSPGTLERLMRSGLPHIKLGNGRTGSVRFWMKDLEAYVEQRRVVICPRGGAAA